jgi:hypothetical protein
VEGAAHGFPRSSGAFHSPRQGQIGQHQYPGDPPQDNKAPIA